MIKKTIFTLFTFLIFFILLEGAFRIIYTFWYQMKYKDDILEAELAFYKHDPTLGWIITPNFKGIKPGTETYYKTNSLGLRDGEYSFQKPSIHRILCLGDSITEGAAFSNDKTYPKLIEKKLNSELSGKHFEVINAGISDYGIEQECILLEKKGLRYNPNTVILGYYLNDGRGFVPSKAIYNEKLENILNESKFLYLLDRCIMKYKIKYQYKIWEKNRHGWIPFYEKGTWRINRDERYKLIELAKRDWGLAWTDEGWKRTEFFLRKILDSSKNHKFRLVVLALPVSVQLYADYDDKYMFIPQEKLKEFCRDNDITFIDMLPILRKFKESDVYSDQCHYTSFGLELVSQAVFESIKNNNF